MQNWYSKFLISPLVLALVFATSSFTSAGQKISIPLSGTAVVNIVTNMGVSPAVLDMGDVEVGVEAKGKLTISNLGAGAEHTIIINGASLTGANSHEFDVELPQYTSLAAGESIELDVTFFPVTTGMKTAALNIDSDGASADHIVVIKGVGAEPAVSELQVAPATLSLGVIDMGSNSSKNIVLSVQGDANAPFVILESLEITGDDAGDFSSNLGSQTSMAPGENQQITVTLNGQTYGDKTATLSIKHDGVNPTVKVDLTGTVKNPDEPEQTPEFTEGVLAGLTTVRPTALQFGPDGKLYLAQMDGTIKVLTVQRNGKNNYAVTATETINLVQNMTNHNDDGSVNGAIVGRLVTGILVTGSAQNPVIHVVSGDPRQGAGPSGTDTNLDTNSGVLSKLTKQGGNWIKQDLVRGIPRSEENHQGNGLVFDQSGTKLLVSVGGNTNTGAPSHNFALIPEVALGAAIIEVNINALGSLPYDLPTLDDEDRAGANDQNDPFGGNDGKNQAILKANGPVQIYSPGFRNAYDLVMTQAGRLYTFDNGGNAGWGGEPLGNCTNDVNNGGNTYNDALHYISNKGYYGGHPNPTRGNKSNTFNASNPQSPIEGAANPAECNFLIPGVTDPAISKVWGSTNGMDEYTASNFGGAMAGDLLAASFDKAIYRFELNGAGNTLLSKSKLFANAGSTPLDVTAQGDGDIFPGTVWVADYGSSNIRVFEPQDY